MNVPVLRFRKIAFLCGFLFISGSLFSQRSSLEVKEGEIIYHKDSVGNSVLDFSYCGYKQSNVDIPVIENTFFVPLQKYDATEVIQQAVEYVEKLPLNESGFRGAVLLDKGVFTITGTIFISKSGVVLRGSGKNETILQKTGVDRNAMINIEGINDYKTTDTVEIISDYVPVNYHRLKVKDVSALEKGLHVMIYRPSTKQWIEKLGCDHFGGGITYLGWKPGEIDIYWDRTITNVTQGVVEIDAPLTMALDAKDAASKILIYRWPGRISNVGIENLSLVSDYDEKNLKDEDHCWTGISIDNAKDCWIRKINFKYLTGNAVILQQKSSRVTVEDCISTAPVSEIGGMRRNTFLTMGQLNLFQRCYSEEGIHDFGAGYLAAGPNAFVQCETKNSYSYSGAIDSWASGLLFDIVNIDGDNLVFKNLGQDTNGAGWGTSNSLFWQCTASEIECYSPDSENKNRAYGCWAQFSGDGEWGESNNHVKPRSFFYAQLSARLGDDFAERARLLPMNTDATSSPTVEQAMALAMEAKKPKMTLRQWIEDYHASEIPGSKQLITVNQIKPVPINRDHRIPLVKVVNGRISLDNRLLTGGRQEVAWWSGKLRSGNIARANPHITRFVPGREGQGLTDRIDSVTVYMKFNNLSVLDYNYGLWYDRRRDDHERVKRGDGDVWGPFYELPFARSGEGLAWDGLSKYDLTKPNAWYWSRLQEFARKAANDGIILFYQNYFQHHVLEAGAHWVDFPWRTANNVNSSGFPEPVPFAGDKRIFMADFFYDIENPVRRELHKTYINQSLNSFAEQENVVHLTSAEFTGPLHFVQFWIDVIGEWENKSGKDAFIALSVTKDVQDAILTDADRSAIVDIVDIRYWHYKDGGELYAPEGGKNMAPRQFARKMNVGKVSFDDVYKAVSEYRSKFPEKAVTYYAQSYPEMAWAVFMAGGSLPFLPRISDPVFLEDALQMEIMTPQEDTENCYVLGQEDIGKIIYFKNSADKCNIALSNGVYQIKVIDKITGNVSLLEENLLIKNEYCVEFPASNDIYWFEKTDERQ